MPGTLLLGCLAAVSLLWSLRHFRRGDRAIGFGALASGGVLAGGAALHALEVLPWLEGGYGMFVVTMLGAYAIGASVAFRRSGSRGARNASVIAGGVTLGASAVLYQQAVGPLAGIVEGMPPDEAARILAAGSAEAARLPQLAIALVLFAGVSMLVKPRRRPQQLGFPSPRP